VIARAGLLLALAAVAGGCHRDAGAASRPKIALVMKSLANEFFQTMESGARKHHEAHATEYELLANGTKDDMEVGKQIDIVEQMVARGVDAIVIAPADSKALVAALRRAVAAGVVVVNIDNRLDARVLADRGLAIPFVGPSNRKGARAVGEVLAKTLHPGAQVAIIEGLPTADNARERRAGFDEAAAAAGLNVVATQAGNWDMSKANELAAALLTAHPKLEALLCANDSMALGAVAAVKAAGRTSQVKVIGFDAISAVRELVRSGQVLATADQHGDELAVYGIDAALDIIAHKAPPEDRETPVDVVTAVSLGGAR
jgi:ribose transport system substrate-binding protein